MLYSYLCETKDGLSTSFMDERYHDFGTLVERNGIEYEVVDIVEEYPISVSEIMEVYEDMQNW